MVYQELLIERIHSWLASIYANNINGELDPLSWKICFCLSRVTYGAYSLTWPAYMLINMSKRKFLHEKRVQFPLGCLGTPTWLPYVSLFWNTNWHGCHDVIWIRSKWYENIFFLSLWLKGLVTEVKILSSNVFSLDK